MKAWIVSFLLGVFSMSCWADWQATPDATINKLILQEVQNNVICRDGPGNAATKTACQKRNAIDRELHIKGWCYGSPGQASEQRHWQRCESPSTSMNGREAYIIPRQGYRPVVGQPVDVRRVRSMLYKQEVCYLPVESAKNMHRYRYWNTTGFHEGCWGELPKGDFFTMDQDGTLGMLHPEVLGLMALHGDHDGILIRDHLLHPLPQASDFPSHQP